MTARICGAVSNYTMLPEAWFRHEEMVPGVKRGIGLTLNISSVEEDDLFLAAVVAQVRRRLPALLAECDAAAREAVFPGDARAGGEVRQ